ncbi:hypothetical protein ES288_A10G133400v1 [Gossypium darwinii]|uniref:Uncharacterized protein n=1 Tax=Gossypium darwinii TaxID=34276 RepID=A0A5D2F0I8_GOSDA|nr:hypothetical protein ES288_A10G133400v1 [Gossypium darwinii]
MAGGRRCGERAFKLFLQSPFLKAKPSATKERGEKEFSVPLSNPITTTEKSLIRRARRDSGVDGGEFRAACVLEKWYGAHG